MSKPETSEIIAQIIDSGGSLCYNYRKEGRHALLDPRHDPIGYIEDDVVTFVNPDFDMSAFKKREAEMYNLTLALNYIGKASEALRDSSDWASGKRMGKKHPLTYPSPLACKAAHALHDYREEILADLKKLA
jgi:hypothetical protein